MFADRIYADFQNLDDEQRIRLTTAGSVRDLALLPPVAEGDELHLYTDDADDEGHPDPLFVDGVAERSPDGNWVVRVNWSTVRNASDELAEVRKNQ